MPYIVYIPNCNHNISSTIMPTTYEVFPQTALSPVVSRVPGTVAITTIVRAWFCRSFLASIAIVTITIGWVAIPIGVSIAAIVRISKGRSLLSSPE